MIPCIKPIPQVRFLHDPLPTLPIQTTAAPHNEALLEVVIAHGGHGVAATHLVPWLRHDHVPRLGHVAGEAGEHSEAENEGIAVLDASLQPGGKSWKIPNDLGWDWEIIDPY